MQPIIKVYQSLVLPVMDYCDVAWSSIGKMEHDKLDRAQRRATMIVLKTNDSNAETDLKWLHLFMRRDMHTINLTFKCLKGSPPVFFKDYFKIFRTIHSMRGSGNNLLLPKVRTETARKSFHFNGSKLFNSIPSEVKDSKSVVIFKTRILELYRSKVFFRLVLCIHIYIIFIYLLLLLLLLLFYFIIFIPGPSLIAAFYAEEITLAK